MSTALNYGLIILLFLAWVALFAVKDGSREASLRIGELERDIGRHQETIRTLMTDWEILNEPGYLQGLAQAHLGLDTMRPGQIVTMAALPAVPLHMPTDASTGTFFAGARGMQQLSLSNGSHRSEQPRIDPFTTWPQPQLRPQPGGDE